MNKKEQGTLEASPPARSEPPGVYLGLWGGCSHSDRLLSKAITLQNTPPFTNAGFLNYLYISKMLENIDIMKILYLKDYNNHREDQVDTFGLAVRFTCAEDP